MTAAARKLAPPTTVESASPPSAPRTSGVFVKAARSGPPAATPTPTAESIAATVCRRLGIPLVAVLLHASSTTSVRAAVRGSAEPLDQGLAFALRMQAWLAGVEIDKPAIAPSELAPFVAGRSYRVFEIASPGWQAGFVVVDADLSELTFRALRDEVFDVALRIEEADRRVSLSLVEWV